MVMCVSVGVGGLVGGNLCGCGWLCVWLRWVQAGAKKWEKMGRAIR